MRRNFLTATILFTLLISGSITSTSYAEQNNVDCASNTQAENHFKRGIKYSVSGSMDAALNEYLQAIKLNPYLAKAYNNLGFVYRQKGKADLAIQYYEKALELNPNDDTAHTNLASVYDCKGNYDKAIDEFHKALDLDPGSITVELALEKVIQKKANAEGKTFDQVKAEVATMYPQKETAPCYSKYMDLLNEKDAEKEAPAETITTPQATETTPQVEEETAKELAPVIVEEEIEVIQTTKETTDSGEQYEKQEIDIIERYLDNESNNDEPSTMKNSQDNSEMPENKVEALLKDPQVGALMVLYKQ